MSIAGKASVAALDTTKVTPATVAKLAYGLFKIGAATATAGCIFTKYGVVFAMKIARHPVVAFGEVVTKVMKLWTNSRLEVVADAGVLQACEATIREELVGIWNDPAQKKLLLASLAAVVTASLAWWLAPIVLVKIQTFLTFLAEARTILLALPS